MTKVNNSVMLKLAVSMWTVAGATLAGACVLAVLLVPGLAEHEMKAIPLAALAGFVIAIPLAHLVARRITAAAL